MYFHDIDGADDAMSLLLVSHVKEDYVYRKKCKSRYRSG